jgi:pimeloyl-ACP methyl ester carboxylesterase
MVGARDIMAPPKNARELIGALREARVVDLPDCGHSMMAEQPDAVLDALRSFV